MTLKEELANAEQELDKAFNNLGSVKYKIINTLEDEKDINKRKEIIDNIFEIDSPFKTFLTRAYLM